MEALNIQRTIKRDSSIQKNLTEEIIINKLNSGEVVSNWMEIFNSETHLSNEFIVEHIRFIEWDQLTRPLDEPLLKRYALNIVNWNAQLYGRPLTFEYLTMNKFRFDWKHASQSPPKWFNDIHYEQFGDMMDWYHITKFSKSLDVRTLLRYCEELDWDWISENDIRSDSFAMKFMKHINWDHPKLDIEHLSVSFILHIKDFQDIVSDMNNASQIDVIKI